MYDRSPPNIVGRTFGHRTVIEFAGCAQRGEQQVSRWRVRCSCGTEQVVRKEALRVSASCGCYQRVAAAAAKTKHGCSSRRHGETRTYRIWKGMKTRCLNRNSQHFADHGGRGISICERWHKFENFVADMGEAPAGLSIDRIDNNGDYSPENCRWATMIQQASNTRRSHYIAAAGRIQTITEWSRQTGLSRSAIKNRLFRGHSPEFAVGLERVADE